MHTRQFLGIGAALALIIGVFAPLVSMPIVGSISFFNNGQGDGAIVLGIGVLSLIFALIRRYRLMALGGILSLLITTYAFFSVQSRVAAMKEELAGNMFAGLINVQMGWGWPLLFAGGALLMLAPLINRDAEPAPLPGDASGGQVA